MDPAALRDLTALCRWRMPFGRFEGTPLIELPEPYLVWFRQHGFPEGRLGQMLALTLEVKTHGLEPVVREAARHLPRHAAPLDPGPAAPPDAREPSGTEPIPALRDPLNRR